MEPTLRQIRIITAVLAVLLVGFLGYAAYSYIPQDDGIEIATSDGRIAGVVVFRLESGASATWSIDGEVLATDAPSLTWDTRTAPNGRHTVRADDVMREFDVQNPRRDLDTTATVVGASTAIAVGGSAVGSSVASQVTIAAAQVGKETLLALGEDHLAVRTAAKRKHMPSRIALAITLLMVFLFFAFEGMDRLAWADYAEALPLVGGVAAVFVAMGLGVEALLAFAGRAKSQVRFLFSGAISLVLSSLLFRTPFGYPGYVHEDDDADADGEADQPAHVEAWRALASILVLFTLLLPFLFAARWHGGIADVALEIAIISAATAALPIRPMPGYDIWKWRRSVALLLVIAAYVLYFGFQLGFLPFILLTPLGVLGALVYLATFAYLRGVTAATTPPWLRALRRARANMQGASLFVPETVVAAARRFGLWSARAATQVDAVIRRALAGLHVILKPFTFLAARREQQRAQARQDAAERRFIADAQAFLARLEDLDDDVVVTVEDTGVDVCLGDMRTDLLRMILSRATR